jgi:hypothetical protein
MKLNKMIKKNNLLSLENIVGLLLAILIVFDLKVERNIANVINSPVGIVLSLVLVIVLFIFMNPIVGLLFLIYVYETVKYSSSFLQTYTQPVEKVKKNIMNKLNLANEASKDEVEVKVIEKMAPIVKKGQNNNLDFIPHEENKLKYNML